MSASVYVDFDDVLCETAREAIRLSARCFGTREVAFRAMHSFDLGVSLGLDAAQLTRLMDMLHEPAVIAALRPIEDSREALGRWMKAGFDVHVVTGRPPSTAEASRAWLRDNRMPHSALWFVDKYARWPAAQRGADCLAVDDLPRMGFVLAVDDAPEMVERLARLLPVPVALFDRPWNACVPARPASSPRIFRCRGWRGVLDRFPDPASVAGA